MPRRALAGARICRDEGHSLWEESQDHRSNHSLRGEPVRLRGETCQENFAIACFRG
jgi:hypothetical protein